MAPVAHVEARRHERDDESKDHAGAPLHKCTTKINDATQGGRRPQESESETERAGHVRLVVTSAGAGVIAAD